MKKLFTLVKAIVIPNVNIFKVGEGKQKTGIVKKISTGMLTAWLTAIMLFVSGTYSYILAEPLSKVGLTYVTLALFYIVTVIMMLIGGVTKSQGALFTAKDNDMLLAMPIKKSTIFTTRFIKLLLFEYIWAAIIMIPSIAIYAYFESPAISFYLVSLFMFVLLPIIPMLIATIIGYIIQLLSSRTEKKNLVRTVLGIVFLLVFMYFSYSIEGYIPKIVQYATSISSLLEKIYYPLGVYISCITKVDILKLVYVLAINVVFAFAVIKILSSRYFKLLSKLSEKKTGKGYKESSIQSNSVFKSLVIKEVKKYFSSSIYVMNTIFGVILFLIAAAYVIVSGDGKDGLVSVLNSGNIPITADITKYIPVVVMMMSAFCISTCAISGSSISIERNNFWLLKSLPVSGKQILLAKFMVNILIILPPMLIGNLIFAFGLKIGILDVIEMLVLCIILVCFESAWGLLMNLKFPKLDAANDTVIVKQSLSTLLSLFVPMILAFVPLIVAFIIGVGNLKVYIIIWIGIYALLTGITWLVTSKYGEKRIYKIN